MTTRGIESRITQGPKRRKSPPKPSPRGRKLFGSRPALPRAAAGQLTDPADAARAAAWKKALAKPPKPSPSKPSPPKSPRRAPVTAPEYTTEELRRDAWRKKAIARILAEIARAEAAREAARKKPATRSSGGGRGPVSAREIEARITEPQRRTPAQGRAEAAAKRRRTVKR